MNTRNGKLSRCSRTVALIRLSVPMLVGTSAVACHIEPDRHTQDGTVEEYSMDIDGVRDTLRVRVYVPVEQSAQPTPVVYALGNGDNFDIAADYAAGWEGAPIVVGLGYGRRDWREPRCLEDENRDYTPPPTSGVDTECYAGKADGFLIFLRTRVLPEIESLYTNIDPTRRTLAGHDLGALFAMHSVFAHGREPDFPFWQVVAGDTPIGYDSGALLDRELALYEESPLAPSLPVRLRMLHGKLSDPSGRVYFDELDARLTHHNYANFDYQAEVVDLADDWDMRYVTFDRAIDFAINP